MSHEIRTPMNAIVGFSQMLDRVDLPDETRNDFIKNISINAESLLKMIDDILDLSKLETNQLEIIEQNCQVNGLMQDLKSVFGNKLKSEGKEEINFEMSCPGEDELSIITDRIRLKQTLNNLLDNALKFTESGKISLSRLLSG